MGPDQDLQAFVGQMRGAMQGLATVQAGPRKPKEDAASYEKRIAWAFVIRMAGALALSRITPGSPLPDLLALGPDYSGFTPEELATFGVDLTPQGATP